MIANILHVLGAMLMSVALLLAADWILRKRKNTT